MVVCVFCRVSNTSPGGARGSDTAELGKDCRCGRIRRDVDSGAEGSEVGGQGPGVFPIGRQAVG
eukprot:2787772-Rhodomonas_salina.1